MSEQELKQELSQYCGLPKCQDCGWKLGTDITDCCACMGSKRDDCKHQSAYNKARELQGLLILEQNRHEQ